MTMAGEPNVLRADVPVMEHPSGRPETGAAAITPSGNHAEPAVGIGL